MTERTKNAIGVANLLVVLSVVLNIYFLTGRHEPIDESRDVRPQPVEVNKPAVQPVGRGGLEGTARGFDKFLYSSQFLGTVAGVAENRYVVRVLAVGELPNPKSSTYADCLQVVRGQVIAFSKLEEGVADAETWRPQLGATINLICWGYRGRLLANRPGVVVDDVIRCTLIPEGQVDDSVTRIQCVQQAADPNAAYYYAAEPTVVRGQPDESPVFRSDDPIVTHAELRAQVAATIDAELALSGNGDWRTWMRRTAGVREAIIAKGDPAWADNGLDWFPYVNTLGIELMDDLPEDENPVEALRSFADAFRSRGILFVYVAVPSKFDVYAERLVPIDRDGGSVAPQWRQYLRQLAAAGVNVVDVQPALMSWKREHPDEELFYPDHHWAPAAIRLAATAAARYVMTLPEYRRIATAKERRYSLVRGVQVYAMHLWDEGIARELEAWAVAQRDGGRYVGDGSASILVFGDSNTGIASGHRPGSINWYVGQHRADFAAHLAHALNTPVAQAGRHLAFQPKITQKSFPNGVFANHKVVVYVDSTVRSGYSRWEPWQVPDSAFAPIVEK